MDSIGCSTLYSLKQSVAGSNPAEVVGFLNRKPNSFLIGKVKTTENKTTSTILQSRNVNISLLTKAQELAYNNVAASDLLYDLDNAETGQDVIDALDKYDSAVGEN